jgi:hypothetical protein
MRLVKLYTILLILEKILLKAFSSEGEDYLGILYTILLILETILLEAFSSEGEDYLGNEGSSGSSSGGSSAVFGSSSSRWIFRGRSRRKEILLFRTSCLESVL